MKIYVSVKDLTRITKEIRRMHFSALLWATGLAFFLASNVFGRKVFSPFGPPYPVTAAWFQDKFTKNEWNKSLSDFMQIGGDTVLLRAPPIMLTTEEQIEQDPEFQVTLARWGMGVWIHFRGGPLS